MIAYVNYTDHPIRLQKGDGTIQVVPPSGHTIRVHTQRTAAGVLSDGMQLAIIKPTKLAMPSRREGVILLVSTYVLHAIRDQYPDRDDVMAPDTSDDSAIKDKCGRVKAVRRLMRNTRWQP